MIGNIKTTGKFPETAFVVHDNYEIEQVKKGFVVSVTGPNKCTTDAIGMTNDEILDFIIKMAKRIEKANRKTEDSL